MLPGLVIWIPQIQNRIYILHGKIVVHVLSISFYQVSNVIEHADLDRLDKSISFCNGVFQWIQCFDHETVVSKQELLL